MNWFGEDWGAPVCGVMRHVETPVGYQCERCKKTIVDGDQGVVLSYREIVWHIDCFVKCVVPD